MPTMTMVGTPDPDEDLHRRVAALEGLLSSELRQLRLSLERQPATEDPSYRLGQMERRIGDLESVVTELLSAYRNHTHHAQAQTTGGVV